MCSASLRALVLTTLVVASALPDATPRAATTTPPPFVPVAGIPVPDFGTTEAAGATTLVVPAGGSLPNPIPAGAVIEIQGTHARSYSGGNAVRCAGTASQPAF